MESDLLSLKYTGLKIRVFKTSRDNKIGVFIRIFVNIRWFDSMLFSFSCLWILWRDLHFEHLKSSMITQVTVNIFVFYISLLSWLLLSDLIEIQGRYFNINLWKSRYNIVVNIDVESTKSYELLIDDKGYNNVETFKLVYVVILDLLISMIFFYTLTPSRTIVFILIFYGLLYCHKILPPYLF